MEWLHMIGLVFSGHFRKKSKCSLGPQEA